MNTSLPLEMVYVGSVLDYGRRKTVGMVSVSPKRDRQEVALVRQPISTSSLLFWCWN